MSHQKRNPILLILTASAGLISALISIAIVGSGRYPVPFLPGALFGAVVAGCLAFRGYLRDLWTSLGIIAVSTFAYYASIQAAFADELYSPFHPPDQNGTVSYESLFVGGMLGAFLVLGAVSLLKSEMGWRRRAFNCLCWSPVGGILGIAGWGLGPFLGMALWSVAHSWGLTVPAQTFQNALHGDTSHMYSLWVVWQTGVGFLLGLVLHGPAEIRRVDP